MSGREEVRISRCFEPLHRECHAATVLDIMMALQMRGLGFSFAPVEVNASEPIKRESREFRVSREKSCQQFLASLALSITSPDDVRAERRHAKVEHGHSQAGMAEKHTFW